MIGDIYLFRCHCEERQRRSNLTDINLLSELDIREIASFPPVARNDN